MLGIFRKTTPAARPEFEIPENLVLLHTAPGLGGLEIIRYAVTPMTQMADTVATAREFIEKINISPRFVICIKSSPPEAVADLARDYPHRRFMAFVRTPPAAMAVQISEI